jgi:hypothetical protein
VSKDPLTGKIFSLDAVFLLFSEQDFGIYLAEFGVRAAGVPEPDSSESPLHDLMHTGSDHADYKRCLDCPYGDFLAS